MGTESNRDGFENDVKMYGTQTYTQPLCYGAEFENDVKMYGTQTISWNQMTVPLFENDVKMYGTQTTVRQMVRLHCLRMM